MNNINKYIFDIPFSFQWKGNLLGDHISKYLNEKSMIQIKEKENEYTGNDRCPYLVKVYKGVIYSVEYAFRYPNNIPDSGTFKSIDWSLREKELVNELEVIFGSAVPVTMQDSMLVIFRHDFVSSIIFIRGSIHLTELGLSL